MRFSESMVVGVLIAVSASAQFLPDIRVSPTRIKVVPLLMPRALWWFRWAAVVTVLAGIWYWMMIVTADAHNAQTNGGGAIGTFFTIWTVAFVIEMGLLMSPAEFLRRGLIFALIMAAVVIASGYLYLALNAHGWESNRLLAIGIGGGLGWFMLLNVWGIIWRIQKKLIRWTRDSAAETPMPAEAARLLDAGADGIMTNEPARLAPLFQKAVAP